MILFRADANSALGSGHMMRCLSLASAFLRLGEPCLFVTADANADMLLSGKPFSHETLGTDWQNLPAELPAMRALIEKCRPRLLVVDHYFVTAGYLEALNHAVPTAYIDDLNAFDYPVNTVVNYNIYGPDLTYLTKNARLLLGPDYAPLRAEFSGLPRRTAPARVKNVLVSTGGADPGGVAAKILDAIGTRPDWSGMRFHFVAGALNPHLPELRRKAAALPNAGIHANVTDMSALMLSCDMAVSAAGSTMYELCACGTPTVTYTLADNQLPGADGMVRHSLMLSAGDTRSGGAAFLARLTDCISTLAADAALRQSISSRMQQLVDGNGASRLASALLQY